ncbi:MAG: DUF2938 domain-containing protein [Hyphomonadaceae bacterium]|nr:DUF2938 domain-containing protein [Hyphomonadaceae bacterium]
MGEVFELASGVALVGVGATALLDVWSIFLKLTWGVPFPNYTLVGRWIGHFPRGQFAHASMAEAPAVAGEALIGWTAHYAIGVLYAALLVAVGGLSWLSAPTLLPALAVGAITVVAPFLIMQPAMGAGIASSRASNPNTARLRSLAAHVVFGFGLYLSALALVSI